MTLSISDVISDGIDRLININAVWYFAVLFFVNIGAFVGTSSQIEAQRDTFEDEIAGIGLVDFTLDEYPLAVDIPVALATLLWIFCTILLITVSLLVFRRLSESTSADYQSEHSQRSEMGVGNTSERDDASPSFEIGESDWGNTGDESDEMPTVQKQEPDRSIDSVPVAGLTVGAIVVMTVHGFIASILAGIAVAIGLLIFIIPGLYIATILLFTHPYIATERVSVTEAMKRSIELTKGHRFRVFGVFVVAALTFVIITTIGGLISLSISAIPVLSQLTDIAFSSLSWLVMLAIFASAFDKLRDIDAEEAHRWDGIDDELLP